MSEVDVGDPLERAREALLARAGAIFGSERAARAFWEEGHFFSAGELSGQTVAQVGASREGLGLLWRYLGEFEKGSLVPIALAGRDISAFRNSPYLQVLGGVLCRVDHSVAVPV